MTRKAIFVIMPHGDCAKCRWILESKTPPEGDVWLDDYVIGSPSLIGCAFASSSLALLAS